MAEFVGSFAASHGPLIAREWERLPAAPKERLAVAFRELGRRLTAVLALLSYSCRAQTAGLDHRPVGR